NVASAAVNTASNVVSTVGNAVSSGVATAANVGRNVASAVVDTGRNVASAAVNTASNVAGAVGNAVSSGVATAANVGRNVASAVVDTGRNVVNTASNVIGSGIDAIGGAATAAGGWIGDRVNDAREWVGENGGLGGIARAALDPLHLPFRMMDSALQDRRERINSGEQQEGWLTRGWRAVTGGVATAWEGLGNLIYTEGSNNPLAQFMGEWTGVRQGGDSTFASMLGSGFRGVTNSVANFVDGTVSMVTDPLGTAEGLVAMVARPGEIFPALWDVLKNNFIDNVINGRPEDRIAFFTEILGDIVIDKLTGGTSAANRANRAANMAGNAADLARTANRVTPNNPGRLLPTPGSGAPTPSRASNIIIPGQGTPGNPSNIILPGQSTPGNPSNIILPGQGTPGNPSNIILPGQSTPGNPSNIILPGQSTPGRPSDLILPGQSTPGRPSDLILPGQSTSGQQPLNTGQNSIGRNQRTNGNQNQQNTQSAQPNNQSVPHNQSAYSTDAWRNHLHNQYGADNVTLNRRTPHNQSAYSTEAWHNHLQNQYGADNVTRHTNLSDFEARQWYLNQEAQIRNMLDTTSPLQQQANQAYNLRNQFRTQARDLMANRSAAEILSITEPNMTWAQVIAKYQGKGLSGDALWQEIINASTRSRVSVNQSLGLQ
ncbi:MAG: hypothetical protein FWC91_14305, partial [Defluviitaleaceae bacterium]|nr:hypothetical protein [Defluviitaleaceae bacterium]